MPLWNYVKNHLETVVMPQTDLLCSIIIPTFNHAHVLSRCLQSVISQTFESWEAIIVNNFSQDNTVDIIADFCEPRFHLINFNNNGIIAASRNMGIRNSRGRYVAFLDSDDWWYSNKLEIVLQRINEYDLAFHDFHIYYENRRKKIKKMRGRYFSDPVFVDLMLKGNPISNSSVVVKRNLIEQVGYLSEEPSLVAVEDFDLWLRISRQTEKFLYIPKSLGGYWKGEGCVSRVSHQKEIERQENVYNKHLLFLSEKNRKQAEMNLSYFIGTIKSKMGLINESHALLKYALGSENNKIRLKAICRIILNRLTKKKQYDSQ